MVSLVSRLQTHTVIAASALRKKRLVSVMTSSLTGFRALVPAVRRKVHHLRMKRAEGLIFKGLLYLLSRRDERRRRQV